MICTTTRNGDECVLMTSKGCSFEGGTCLPIAEQCEGCSRVKTYDAGKYCTAFPAPAEQWRLGNCTMATHMAVQKAVVDGKKKVNPLKASKRR